MYGDKRIPLHESYYILVCFHAKMRVCVFGTFWFLILLSILQSFVLFLHCFICLLNNRVSLFIHFDIFFLIIFSCFLFFFVFKWLGNVLLALFRCKIHHKQVH
eukprot:848422_1